MGILLDWDAVVHLIYAKNLGFPAVAAKFVILAHDQRLDGLRGADFCTQPAETAPGQIEVEIIQNFDFLPGLAVASEGDQVVGTCLRALVANDAGLGPGPRFGLQPENAPESGSRRSSFRRILKSEGGLRRVLERHPQTLQQVDQKNRLQELEEDSHNGTRWLRSLSNQNRLGLTLWNDSLLPKHSPFLPDLVLQPHQAVQ